MLGSVGVGAYGRGLDPAEVENGKENESYQRSRKKARDSSTYNNRRERRHRHTDGALMEEHLPNGVLAAVGLGDRESLGLGGALKGNLFELNRRGNNECMRKKKKKKKKKRKKEKK